MTHREPTLAAFSACALCAHGADEGLERVCRHPALQHPFNGPEPVAIVRAAGGGCGPTATQHQPSYRGQA